MMILVIEDDIGLCASYSEYPFFPMQVVLTATNTVSGYQLFVAHRETLAVIVFDGHLGDEPKDAAPQLVRQMRQDGYTGPMVAASGDEAMCELLVQAGCDYSVEGRKLSVFVLLNKILMGS